MLCFNLQTIYKIFKSGYSRIPIYDEDDNHVVSIILTKDLVFIDPEVNHSLTILDLSR